VEAIIRRLIQLVVVLVIVTFFTAILSALLPGDPVKTIAPFATDQQRAEIRNTLGLDENIVVRYGKWLGHFVTGGVTHLLPRCVGHQRAIELIVLGERQDAQALHRLGIVNRVVPPAELMPRALDIANRVAAQSALSTSQLKRVIHQGLGAQLGAALDLERDAAMACFASAETAQRVEAFTTRRL